MASAPALGPDPARVAVVLNRQARRVQDALAGRLAGIVGAENLFYTRTLDEAQAAAKAVVARGYGTVACGGGDGTLTAQVHLVRQAVLARRGDGDAAAARRDMPRFAVLALGTGNALQPVVGAGAAEADLARLCRGRAWAERTIDLIGGLARPFSFGGLGYDADLLHDFAARRDAARTDLGRRLAGSLAGYLAAAATRTVPRTLRRPAPVVEITAISEAFYLDPRGGDVATTLAPGSLLYRGPAHFVGLATTPYFGYGFRAFPFALLRPGAMQVRVASLAPWSALAHLPGLWRGTHRDAARLLDFWATSVRVRCAVAQPFQAAGDAVGELREGAFAVEPAAVRLVSYFPAAAPVDAPPRP